MGEIAEDMIEGETCSHCGCFFEEAHGYPVICKSCWNNLSESKKREAKKNGLQPALEETL